MTHIAVTLICLQPLKELSFLEKNWEARVLGEDPYLFTENLLRRERVSESHIGILGAKAHGLCSSATEKGQWLRADPLKLHADLRQVYSSGNQDFVFTPEELQELSNCLNQHFLDEGLKFFPISAQEWYCFFPEKLDLKTYSPLSLTNNPIQEYMPTGSDRLKIGRWMTEIQMLLHQHPLNMQRRRHHLPTIDSLWFWGSGTLPSDEFTATHLSPTPPEERPLILSQVPWVKSLAETVLTISVDDKTKIILPSTLTQDTIIITEDFDPVFLETKISQLKKKVKRYTKKNQTGSLSFIMGNIEFSPKAMKAWWKWW